ncbi:MAG TPA: bifunctional riboflavin kinase/FAD synthetase [Bacteroidales bacterium]|jgi:riboflavin kinase/FMN adenylyltransferase|nr:bifunctional riboflavin kinase/FAD synthetase [Bacteroidales bacterium]HQH24262.1 bifunctional riboflavin kinase/FAD synthetase [Bacteroidales bacterium]HQJ81498.1 bifunctional riboflavin kinase/FAD synthetase [Bacteroidales bacterium]
MEIHYSHENLQIADPFVTIGIFDGVHTGHMAIINRLVSYSRECRGESVVITFDPHPKLVLGDVGEGISYLSTMDEKKALLAAAGTGHLVIMEFTREFSRVSAGEFVNDVLAAKLGTRHLVIGHDHHFGYRGAGNYSTVREYAARAGIAVEQIEGIVSDGAVISSSRIRSALASGRLNDANRWLGYSYSLRGTVVRGRKIGRKLGFPTANIKPSDRYKLIPANGVYAVEIRIEGMQLTGMLSIGTNPTVSRDQGTRSVEVNIFDFDRDIYGSELEIVFRYRMRDEVKFSGRDELARQMRKDMDNALKLLGQA